jgi:hypothetical protein
MNMRFVRYGGLSAVKYDKKIDLESGWNRGFHCAPVRRGIYAFIDPYVEAFLWAWKLPRKEFDETEDGKRQEKEYYRKQTRQLRRVFEYEGQIWCHFGHRIDGLKRGGWVLTDTVKLAEVLPQILHEDRKQLQKDPYTGRGDKIPPVNPYVRGLGGCMSRDHLEVFIDAKHLCKIGGRRPDAKEDFD